MEQTKERNGYVIQLYQYARRYRYNNEGCLDLFNHMLEKQREGGREPYTLEKEFLTFGDFDLLQVIPVESFRQYHDVSELAKDWLGKRQRVLLYDVSDAEAGGSPRICYDEEQRLWKSVADKGWKAKFFCLSMLSLTNEIMENVRDIGRLLGKLRQKIVSVVETLNASQTCKLECEVFGTFNTSEVGIIWLSDQYVDILQVMDYVKHLKVFDGTGSGEEGAGGCPAFLASFSAIAIKEDTASKEVLGNALVQIAVHDVMEDHAQLKQFADEIVGDEDGKIQYSVGEYDLVIEVSSKRAIELIQFNGLLSVGEREQGSGEFKEGSRCFLRSNIRLLYDKTHTAKLWEKLEELQDKRVFQMAWDEKFRGFSRQFEWEELKQGSGQDSGHRKSESNADYFLEIRGKLKERVSPSAGAVDTLDLLYADYQSAISSAYSAMWVSDLHRQFKAVLYAINLLLDSKKLGWSWDEYRELTNVFKQQIYHLTQSSRMFFEIPSCHLRATGQYDFLMHAYYGITKKILEVIYSMQGEKQSELVPLITVNTVPQVKTQLYFEVGEDSRRVINLDIPNSIIFDFQRGIGYLTHELFHYAAPQERERRNFFMGRFLVFSVFKEYFYFILKNLLKTKTNGLNNTENVEKAVGWLFGEKDRKSGEEEQKPEEADQEPEEADQEPWEGLQSIHLLANRSIWEYVSANFYEKFHSAIKPPEEKKTLSNIYQKSILELTLKRDSQNIFREMFVKVYPAIFKELLKAKDYGEPDALQRVKERILYCLADEAYVPQFVDLQYGNFSYEVNKKIDYVGKYLWGTVREVCSDIAMVSLNDFHLEDYMLFCIQMWTDAGNNKSEVLEKMNDVPEEKERLRYYLVTEYFYMRSKWDGYADGYRIKLDKRTEAEFCKQYVWFYAGKNLKRSGGQDQGAKDAFEHLYREAKDWLIFFRKARRECQGRFMVPYDDIYKEIFPDYDIESRIAVLEKAEIYNKEADRLKEIREGFLKVRQNYRESLAAVSGKIFGKNSEFDLDEIVRCDAIYKDNRFKQDIRVMYQFQNQKSFRELGEINEELKNGSCCLNFEALPKTEMCCIVGEKETTGVLPWRIRVHSLTELLFYLRYCYEELNRTAGKKDYIAGQRKNPKIWFRGHSSTEYTHVPTVMRSYKRDQCLRHQSLRGYQQSNFEEFKARADGAAEMPRGLRFTLSDYIAMMQHYAAPTNFLDWTENAITSLYMAFKYYLKKELTEKDKKYRDVTLSVFHAGIYNHVRYNSLKAIQKAEKKPEWVGGPLGKVLDPENQWVNLVPNLSVKENEERFDMFLLGDIRFESYWRHLEKTELEDEEYKFAYNTDMRDLFLPMAILTSRLNPRIRTQGGCFVAYNLYSPPNELTKLPEGSSKSWFEYLSLEEIQERKKEEAIFMYQLVIDKECCGEVAEWLKSLGVSRENIYPELSEKGYYFE